MSRPLPRGWVVGVCTASTEIRFRPSLTRSTVTSGRSTAGSGGGGRGGGGRRQGSGRRVSFCCYKGYGYTCFAAHTVSQDTLLCRAEEGWDWQPSGSIAAKEGACCSSSPSFTSGRCERATSCCGL